MPMYEFSCSGCGHRFEEIVFKSSDEEDLECPECGSRDVKRALSAFAVSTKGGGLAGPSCSGGGGGFS